MCVAKRLLHLAGVLLVVTFLTFLFLRMLPGDPVLSVTGIPQSAADGRHRRAAEPGEGDRALVGGGRLGPPPHAHGASADAEARRAQPVPRRSDQLARDLGQPLHRAFNTSGQPAISLPTHHRPDDDMPIGVQLAAAYGREDVLIQVASQIESEMPWAGRHPTE